jgi:hypothetical protein
MAELGARYNAFSLSEQSPTLAAAIERIGQSVDSSYIATKELSLSLGAGFAEPMRESAQFAGVVRGVLRYRILKRVQEEMTKEELSKKQALLESLERSEAEAHRIDQYLNSTNPPGAPLKRSGSSRSAGVDPSAVRPRRERVNEDTASIDSDFPPTHGETPSSPQGTPQKPPNSSESPSTRTSQGGNFVTQKIFGRLSHAMHGIVDVDPERTRRDQIGKTKESIGQVRLPPADSSRGYSVLTVHPVGASAGGGGEGCQRRERRDLERSQAVPEGKGRRPQAVHGTRDAWLSQSPGTFKWLSR